eukprot:3167994-Prymnesium_polylepis.1
MGFPPFPTPWPNYLTTASFCRPAFLVCVCVQRAGAPGSVLGRCSCEDDFCFQSARTRGGGIHTPTKNETYKLRRMQSLAAKR